MRVSYPFEYCRNCDALIEAHSNTTYPRKKQLLIERKFFACSCLLQDKKPKEYLLIDKITGSILTSGKTLAEIKKGKQTCLP